VPFTVGGGTMTPVLSASSGTISVPEGGSATVTYRLSAAPSAAVAVTLARTGDADLTVAPTSFSLTSANWNTGVAVTVSAAQDADQSNGTATIAASSSAGNVVLITLPLPTRIMSRPRNRSGGQSSGNAGRVGRASAGIDEHDVGVGQ
jgi:cellulose 1,4-beta-cellobiosidase